MNSKWHLYISTLKSGIRIASCIIAFEKISISILALGFMLAEILGILEELNDQR